MNREILKLTGEEGREILWEDSDDYEIVSDDVVNNTRWSIFHDVVIKRLSDGKFFRSSYSVGATEYQDERPYEYGEAIFSEVKPVEKVVIAYEWND